MTRGSALLLALKVALLSLALGPRNPSGEVVRPVMQYLLSAWREEEQEREEGTVQDWPGQSLRGWTWCWYRLGERSTASSLSCP